jgi:hypothetical protein
MPSTQKATYNYTLTETGREYGVASFTGFSSSKKTKSSEYTEKWYCFTAGFHKYTLVRSTLFYGGAYQDEYPVHSVIDALFAGDRAVTTCDDTNQPDYCREEDSSKLADIITNANNFYPSPINDGNFINQQYSNPDAYPTSQVLKITEWGVALLVPKDLGILSYKPATGDAIGTMSLTSSLFSKPECEIGLYTNSNGARSRANGIATIGRTAVAEAKARYDKSRAESNGQSFISTSGTELADGYIYSISTNSYLKGCLAAEGIGGDRAAEIEDMLNWMETQLKLAN